MGALAQTKAKAILDPRRGNILRSHQHPQIISDFLPPKARIPKSTQHSSPANQIRHQPKTGKHWFARAGIMAAIFVLGVAISVAGGKVPYQHAAASSAIVIKKPVLAPQKQPSVVFGLPVRLSIPKISVDTAVDSVGLTPQGDLGVPQGPTNVGWFSLGSRPGEQGSAVIDGHFGYKDHIPAVFDNLHKLQAGDTVSVADEKGISTSFVVRELRVYGQNEIAREVFNSNDGKAHLNLITCNGTWSNTQKSYANRLVIFTDKI